MCGHGKREGWEELDLKVLLVMRNTNEEESQWGGGGGGGGGGSTAGQRETKTRGKVAGCTEMLGEARMTQAERSEREPVCYTKLGVLAERMQCVGEEEEEDEEEKGMLMLGGRNVNGRVSNFRVHKKKLTTAKKDDDWLRNLELHDRVSLRVNNLSAGHQGKKKNITWPDDSNKKEKKKERQ